MFKHLKDDFPSSLVVYLVALPLCLGIAIASDAPLFAGMLAGIVGGIVIGSLSGSQLSVSGPAAGLAVIVAQAQKDFRALADPAGGTGTGQAAFELFLTSVVIAGIIQLILGIVRAGGIGNFIPSSVIHGMLAAIGLILVFKQIPHALGVDTDYEGDESFVQPDGQNTLSELTHSLTAFEPGALVISLVAGALLLSWGHKSLKKYTPFQFIPAALIAVIAGTVLNHLFALYKPEWALSGNHLVTLPLDAVQGNPGKLITFPNPEALKHTLTYETALILAIIASLETLLSLEASDKIDPKRRISNPNRELKAQGIGNMLSGLIGGLPITSVIVRSSANVVAGAKTRMSAILHGILLLISVLAFPQVLNLIPKAALAAVLILVGYKLCSWEILNRNYRKGLNQFVPFITTILAILLSDLLKGIGVGLLVGIIFVVRSNYTNGLTYVTEKGRHLIKLRDSVNYLNKGKLAEIISRIPSGSQVVIDGTSARFIDPDIYELIDDFIRAAPERSIQLILSRKMLSQNEYFKVDGLKFDSENENIRATAAGQQGLGRRNQRAQSPVLHRTGRRTKA